MTDIAMTARDDFYDALFEGNIALLDRLSTEDSSLLGTDQADLHAILSTALLWANEASVAWILTKDPALNYVDDQGFTAIKCALQAEGERVLFHKRSPDEMTQITLRLIDLLIEHGADINFGATLGETPLHTAAMWSSTTVVRHLLKRGADPMIFDDEYAPRQPIYYAEFHKRWDVHAVLVDAMKNADPAGTRPG